MVAFADAPTDSATNSSSASNREEKIAEMEKLMNDGKRDFISNNFAAAVSNLGQAVEFSVEIHGCTDAGAFDPHLWYGRALLELCNLQQDVFDNAMKNMPETNEDDSIDEEKFGDPEKVSEEEKEEVKEKVNEAMSEEARASTKEKEPAEMEGTEEKDIESSPEEPKPFGDTEEAPADAENESENSLAENDTQEDADEEDAADEEEEEASDIQIAWEVFETARTICEKQEQTKDWIMKKAEVLYFLAEVSLLNDDFDKAVEDLSTAIEIQKEHLSANDRGLAQSYLLMARCYKAKDDYENAGKYYQLTKSTILGKIDELESTEVDDDESKKNKADEIESLRSIVADLGLKIQDAEESLVQIEKNMDKIRAQMGLTKKKEILVEKTAAPAVDITNLIRKPVKRPAEEDAVDDNTKKAKTEEEETTTVTA